MATHRLNPSRSFQKLLLIFWNASLILIAGIMLLWFGDPSAALVLAILLPLSCLLSNRHQVIATAIAVIAVTVAGSYLATRPGMDTALRGAVLGAAMMAPLLGSLVILPGLAMRMLRHSARNQALGETIQLVTLENQSSTKFMSDSTAIGILGRLTPDTKQSKAA